MVSQFVLQIGKMPVNCVSGIRDFHLQIIVPGKEPGQICFKASVGTSEPFMDVSVFAERIYLSLV